MTIDGRVNDVMAKLHSWIEQGAHKRFHWDEKHRQHVMESDEETRRTIIEIIVKAGRQDGAEAEREACLTIAKNIKETHKSLKRDQGEHAAFLIENLIRARSEKRE